MNDVTARPAPAEAADGQNLDVQGRSLVGPDLFRLIYANLTWNSTTAAALDWSYQHDLLIAEWFDDVNLPTDRKAADQGSAELQIQHDVHQVLAVHDILPNYRRFLAESAFVAECPWWCNAKHPKLVSDDHYECGVQHEREVAHTSLDPTVAGADHDIFWSITQNQSSDGTVDVPLTMSISPQPEYLRGTPDQIAIAILALAEAASKAAAGLAAVLATEARK